MPMFIQTTDVDSSNNHLHFDNINKAGLLAYIFNTNIMKEPSSLVYNPNTKRVELHSGNNAQYDLHPENSKVIAQQINWFLEFEEQFDNKDLFLVLYLEKFKNITLKETDRKIVNTIFKNLDFEDYFDKISATFLKDKLNELLVI